MVEYYEPLLRYIGETLSGNPRKTYCLDVLKKVIERTSHLARAMNVAYAIGFCRLAARLMQSIGVSKMIHADISGKPGRGYEIHRILALSSIRILNHWRTGTWNRILMRDEVEATATYEIGITDENKRKNAVELTIKLIENLLTKLPDLIDRMDLSNRIERLRIYAEQQLVDYETHIVGTPDLIIEFPEDKRAIIVEWKTYEDTPTKYEWAQAYTYAILEALRLGYSGALEETIDAIVADNLRSVKVIPIIVNPRNVYSKHPAYVHPERIRAYAVDELKQFLKDIILASLQLTLLTVNMDYLLVESHKHKEIERYSKSIREQCSVTIDSRKVNAFTLLPRKFPKGPARSQNRYPCTICPFSDKYNEGHGPCRFYFGEFPKSKTRWDSMMWFFRYVIYGERERELLPLHALYKLSSSYGRIEDLVSDLEKGVYIKFDDITTILPSRYCSEEVKRYDKAENKVKIACGVFEIEGVRYSIGVYDIAEVDENKIILERQLYENEYIFDEDVPPRPFVPRIRHPVLMVFVEPHVSLATLGTSIFAKVDTVLLPEEVHLAHRCPSDKVCIVLVPISSFLRFPFILAKEYYRLYNLRKAILVEVNADLTHVDLRTIDALHRYIREWEHSRFAENREEIAGMVEKALVEAYKTLIEGGT